MQNSIEHCNCMYDTFAHSHCNSPHFEIYFLSTLFFERFDRADFVDTRCIPSSARPPSANARFARE